MVGMDRKVCPTTTTYTKISINIIINGYFPTETDHFYRSQINKIKLYFSWF